VARQAIKITVTGDGLIVEIDGRRWSFATGRGPNDVRVFDIRRLVQLKQDGVEMTVPQMAKLLKRISLEFELARMAWRAWEPHASQDREAEDGFSWRRRTARSRDGQWEVVFRDDRSGLLTVAGTSWRLEMGADGNDPADLPGVVLLCITEGLIWASIGVPREPTGYDLCEYVSAAERALFARGLETCWT
jgi:hypothetical protein